MNPTIETAITNVIKERISTIEFTVTSTTLSCGDDNKLAACISAQYDTVSDPDNILSITMKTLEIIFPSLTFSYEIGASKPMFEVTITVKGK